MPPNEDDRPNRNDRRVAGAAAPLFVDRAGDLPVAHVYEGGWEHFVGGGVAVFDCNGDARPEIFVAGGTNPARLFVNITGGATSPLTFALGDAPPITGVTGAYPLDIDGDGALDLAVLRVGRDILLRGGPDCTFTDASAALGFNPRDAWTTAFSAIWEKGASLPTLAFGHYVDRANPKGPFEACDTSDLYRPSGQIYGAPETISPGFCTLSMLISDWRRSGEPELRVSNDRHYYVRGGYEQMFRLSPLAERTEDWPRVSLWGMGIASQDLNGDGLPEVMMTSMGDQLLQFNTGTGFTDAPYELGTYAQRPFIGDDGRPSTGWHAEFADVDNDGRMDIFIAKGNVDQMPSNAIHDPNNLLMQQPNGSFVERADVAGIATTERARSGARGLRRRRAARSRGGEPTRATGTLAERDPGYGPLGRNRAADGRQQPRRRRLGRTPRGRKGDGARSDCRRWTRRRPGRSAPFRTRSRDETRGSHHLARRHRFGLDVASR